MKSITVYASVLILLLSFPSLKAQDDAISLTLLGNVLLPVGPFGEKIGPEAQITRRFGFDYGKKVGLANTGFGMGAEIRKGVLAKNLAWVISAKCLVNPAEASKITSFFREVLGDTVDISFDFGRWINIPVFTGFYYSRGFGKSLSLYGTVQTGINITRQPYRRATVAGKLVEETTFKFTPDFGFEAGFGIELWKKYNLGVRYLNLSSPRYEGSRRLNEIFFTSIPKRVMNVDGDERPISMLMVFLGYTL